MSDHDKLDRRLDAAARAYAEETAEPSADATATRARVLASHRARRARSERATAWLAAAAALVIVLGGSTAWAYWSGRLASWIGASTETPSTEAPRTPEHEEAPPAPATHTPRPAPVTEPPAPAAPIEPSAPVAAPTSITTDAPVEPGVSEGASEPVDPAERLAYRRAHGLHFDAHDPAGALGAWDAYLASYPRGRFALEARYNRALCLVRLDRRDEAERALAPFAEGTHGDYRQAEAQALLEALRSE